MESIPFSAFAADREKQARLTNNFLSDISALKKYLEDAAVTDIFVIGTGEIVIKVFAKGKVFTGEKLSPSKVRGIILSAAALLDKQIDLVGGLPKLEAVIPPPYNARITGLLPPWVEVPQLTFRKPPKEVFSLESYVESGRMRLNEYEIICSYIRDRKNILIGGGTGSGKSTLTNAVIKKMTEHTPDDRFYIVEDVPELRCSARDSTMISVNPKDAAEAIRTALRWTPDRIIFGEIRYGEVANEYIKALNTGHTGSVTTIHADSCASMLSRMEDLLREVIPGSIPRLADTIHLCVHMAGGQNGPHVDGVMPTVELNLMASSSGEGKA
ncbi:MAG: Flp pilus assembly complex ATPase component TadA [Treponema sp.]|uniref:ATPase, T2SS/T4P/T4SS family n=1 Tax=Treponema sp. TaxID=166 RepID=UPI0025FC4B15|nr:ATPase, T2SS/T4P/T4SS family [Treponema sp.]MBQ8680105.1 Flp pilus assembly complex ATPase component TadA [Treponema sp.]